MASSSSSSLPLPSTHHQHHFTYEVFLSFRGEDTRYTFTDHLHKALIGRGIRTFRDNEELNRGEDISQELLKAIEESRVSIIVFSPNYASSRWCLDELVHILECRRSKGQVVRPLFYRVDPSDVRNQRGAFGDGFAELDQSKYEEDKICKWRTALKEAADLSGWPYKDGEYEAKFIDDIVDELSAKLVNPLPVADHPVGLDSCREDVNRLLDLKKNVVLMVGIWGAGGIGKTTIAKDVFNSIRHKFEGTCFLADVRSKSNGLPKLQQTLLSRILGDSKLEVNSVDEGVGFIETRIRSKKVLIILDDVSHSSQLKKLVPSHNCFGMGSRILITTRDRGCLREPHQVYEVRTLNDCQAMNLFSFHAFRTIRPPNDHLKLAERAIRYAQGLPLALEVLGSHLFGKSIDEWEDTIASCIGDPHTDIQDVLKLSYNALSEDLKEVFLDIACSFKGEKVERVKPILQACHGLNSGIEQLQEKALLRIDEVDEGWWSGYKMKRIWMHDLIEEMGKKIANPKGNPDANTRLWGYDDVNQALSYNTGTKNIKGIKLHKLDKQRDTICLNSKSFSYMKNLKYFFIRNIKIVSSGNINHLSHELRYLEWSKCPLLSFPKNFNPHKLVKLDISYGTHILRLWDTPKDLPNLKYMDLSWCKRLKELPDLSKIPNLVELRLSHCESLVEIPHSIGSLEKLEILDLEGCTQLLKFPKLIGKLDSLRELNLSNTSIEWRTDDEKQLWLEFCQNLTYLEILKLGGCTEPVKLLTEADRGCSEFFTFPARKASISSDDDSGSLLLPKLRELYISFCDLSTADFIGDLDCLETLNNLDLSRNKFVSLPALGKFVNLECLSLRCCEELREIPELPPNILKVDASGCLSLQRFLMLPKYSLNTVQMDLVDCHRFSRRLGKEMKMMENILLNNQDSRFCLVFPSLGYEVPNWFYCSKEAIATEDSWFSPFTVSFEFPSKLELDNIAGVAICSVIPRLDSCIDVRADLSINGVHIQYHYIHDTRFMSSHMWVGYSPLSGEIKGKLLGQRPYTCQVQFDCPFMTSCRVHLVCQPPNENSASATPQSNIPEENVDPLPELQSTLATPCFQQQGKQSRSNMASSSSSSSLPLSSTHHHQHQYTYEVFLSFRGEDMCYNFTDHLHTALIRRGIKTFRDNEELYRGEDISPEPLKAIKEWRVSIIVFSPNYASSRWCLDELVHILECKRSKGQEVRPIFYRVDPSDVRNQRGAFGDGFAELDQSKNENKICKWRKALEEAADLSGWPYKDGEDEAKFIDNIVGELSARVVNPSRLLDVAAYPVGLESCREDVNRLLRLEKNVVRMVGIWGAGGIGKTTIAKAVFNSIRHMFEGSCFIADVRSNSNGLSQLQEKLLSDVLGGSTLKVSHVDEGDGFIKEKMQHKKVLIILDDVSDYSSQLEKLVPSHNCFGQGSRILITTRDKGCLREADGVYEVKTLTDCQAMNLFSLNAFRTIGPPSDHLELAERAIGYAQGLPLALIVLGSHLCLQSKKEWEDTLSSCRGDPQKDIQSVLRLSYDALGEDLKEVFLDIACFFKGEKVERVKPILQACYNLNSGIEQLQEKALLRIERDGENLIWMHDLIEEMGIQIANPKPDESTRLWEFDDVKRALSDNIGRKKIKSLQLHHRHQRGDEICLNAESFSNMENLIYFSVVQSRGWWYDSGSSHITRLWNGCKNLPNLKCMEISCESLTELPDLSGIPNLIRLHLAHCVSLVEISHSIGSLKKLEILNLAYCTGLQEFPKFIGKLDSLRELNLSYTGANWSKEKGIKKLWLECCQNLTNLEILKLSGCSELVRFLREASISPDDDSGSLLLPKLREFDISHCNLSTADFIGDLDCFETLNSLDLSHNDFVTLPALGKFVNLSVILLHHCRGLRKLPELPMLPKYSLNTVQINLVNCDRFSECLGNDMKMMENILLNNEDLQFSLLFSSLGSEVPNWFHFSKEVIATKRFLNRTLTVSFEIRSKSRLDNIEGVAICSVFDDNSGTFRADLSINGVHIHQYFYPTGSYYLWHGYMWVGYTPLSGEIKGKLLGQWPYKCQVKFHGNKSMTSCGVHLVC